MDTLPPSPTSVPPPLCFIMLEPETSEPQSSAEQVTDPSATCNNSTTVINPTTSPGQIVDSMPNLITIFSNNNTVLFIGNNSTNHQTSPPANDEDEAAGATTVSYNPSVTDDLLADMEAIKGDAIGSTLYSSRFVLRTLLRLNDNKAISHPLAEDLEKDLCTLWDMTIEPDVVRLLLEHHMLEHFGTIIRDTDDQRLTEILVGLIGNMCATLDDARMVLSLSAATMATLLHLVTCSDALILVQLMRLLHAALVFNNSGDEPIWFEHFVRCEPFVPGLAFVLQNSSSCTLLRHTYEALAAMCIKFAVIEASTDAPTDLKDLLVRADLIGGMIEAFRQMIPEGGDVLTEPPSLQANKTMNQFLDITTILSQYGADSLAAFGDHTSDLLCCLGRCVRPLQQHTYLFPLNGNAQGIVENVHDILQQLGDPFGAQLFGQILDVWMLLDREQQCTATVKSGGEWEELHETEDEGEVNAQDVQMSLLEMLTRLTVRASDDCLVGAMQDGCQSVAVQRLFAEMSAATGDDDDDDVDPDIRECCQKLETAAKRCWGLSLTAETTKKSRTNGNQENVTDTIDAD